MNFRSEYDTWHQRIGEHEQVIAEPTQPWHVTAARLLPDLNDLRVLEIGCGRGDFSLWIARKKPGAYITAVDLSEAAIALAIKRSAEAGNAVRFEVNDA